VTLTTLIDSPVLAGSYFKKVDLGESLGRSHRLDIAADTASSLAITPETTQHLKNLVTESGALFAARHYAHYDFLLTLSDGTAHFGLEHHQSSDDRTAEKSLVDPGELKLFAGLLPHEMVHSWNGKFRRPAGLATGNYDAPMKGELLWVYEGLTQYLGSILTARSGLWTAQEYRDYAAGVAASLDNRPGRDWRPLADTAVEAQVLYNSPGYWSAWRRGVDFYDEGLLIWLDADTTIRELTKGKKSLDDFCQAFHGAPSAGPEVKPYTLDDVVAALNKVAPYDWAGFFHDRVYKVAPRAPMGGLARGGWKLVYGEEPTAFAKTTTRGGVNAWYSLGFSAGAKGDLYDVRPGSPAFSSGLIPGMVLVAVDGRAFSAEALTEAIRAAKGTKEPIRLTVKSGLLVKDLAVDYHGGERYPRLERIEGTPDLISQILAPHANAK
jgi:predicted metalloprotease with PDZ domain